MKVQVSRISEHGFLSQFSQNDEWVKDKFAKSFEGHWLPTQPLEGKIEIQKTGENLFLKGFLKFDYKAVCDRCLEDYSIPLSLKLERWMVPLQESLRQKQIQTQDEAELTAEDVNFSFYEEDEFDVGDMLVEQVFLDLPVVMLCSPNCKGLCGQCGLNLNEQTCHCAENQKIKDSPFAVLKTKIKK